MIVAVHYGNTDDFWIFDDDCTDDEITRFLVDECGWNDCDIGIHRNQFSTSRKEITEEE